MNEKNSETLEKEEIDALMTKEELGEKYHFSIEEISVYDRYPLLKEVFAKVEESMLVEFAKLIDEKPDLEVKDFEFKKFVNFKDELFVPSSSNIWSFAPIADRMMIILDSKIICMFIENYFGGDGEFFSRKESARFTKTEENIIAKVEQVVIKVLTESFKDLATVSPRKIRCESNHNYIKEFSNDEFLTISSLNLEFSGGSGNIYVVFSQNDMEQNKNIFAVKEQEENKSNHVKWQKEMKEQLSSAKLDITCKVASAKVPLEKLTNLKVGDLIDVKMTQSNKVFANNKPIFLAKIGSHNGNYGLLINSVIERRD